VIDSIPAFYTAHARVACGWDQKGSVMRQLGEQFRERRQHTSDGLRIEIDDYWVLLSPDSDGFYIGVYVEGRDDAHAAALIRQYSELIKGLQ
jgi:phosphomannomutase